MRLAVASAAVGLGEPGVIVEEGDAIRVATGDGVLAIERLQRAGKRELSAQEFMRGAGELVGKRFGPSDA